MASVAVSLALRCFGGPVRIFIPEKEPASLPWTSLSITDFLRQNAAYFGAPERIEIREGYFDDTNTLGLGFQVPTGVTIDATAWVASINPNVISHLPAEAPAAVFATCCGIAKLFKTNVLGDGQWHKESWNFSLQNLVSISSIPKTFSGCDLNLGRISLLGAGAIGSGFAYSLWLSGWSATIDIIDKDIYKEPNIETTLMVGAKDVKWQNKADILAALLQSRPGLTTTPVVTEILPNHKELLKRRDIFVCAVDNAETRRCLDNVNVDMLVNGAVGGTKHDSGHVLWSRHLANEPVLSTLYPETPLGYNDLKEQEEFPNEVSDQCSRLAYQGIDMAAPFIGLSSGALLLASCAHKAINTQLTANYFKFDILRKQSKYNRVQKF